MAMNDLDLSNTFPNTFSTIDQTVLQTITKTNANRMNDQHDLDRKLHANVRIFFDYIYFISSDSNEPSMIVSFTHSIL